MRLRLKRNPSDRSVEGLPGVKRRPNVKIESDSDETEKPDEKGDAKPFRRVQTTHFDSDTSADEEEPSDAEKLKIISEATEKVKSDRKRRFGDDTPRNKRANR